MQHHELHSEFENRPKRWITILGTRIDLFSYSELLEEIDRAVSGRRQLLISAPHFHILLCATRSPALLKILNDCDINHLDGIGAYLAARALSPLRPERINGTDFYSLLLSLALKKRRRVFMLGGTEETVRSLRSTYAEHLESDTPIGFHHGFFSDIDEILPRLKTFNPEILLIGMGTPRQFEVMKQLAVHFPSTVILVVGGGLEFLSGRNTRAPLWMRRSGLEWLHRVRLEPQRLWKRYLFGIPAFAWLVLLEKLRQPDGSQD